MMDIHRQHNRAAADVAEDGADGGGVGEEGRGHGAVAVGDVERPGEEGVVDDASNGGTGGFVGVEEFG